MFYRKILEQLDQWAASADRKPLVLRGARQVGKTSAVNLFSKKFDQYLYLNLDRQEDRAFFEKDLSFQSLIDNLFFSKNIEKNAGKTLVFIDEIQNSPKAVNLLRYFYEDYQELFVIAAGSLLESMIDNQISFPVGRVEYLAMRPCSFEEYLSAANETKALEILDQHPFPEFAHDKLAYLFREFAIIGGMPAIIKKFLENRDYIKLKPIYDGLVVSYLDDVEKYARNATMKHVIRHIIHSSFIAAGERIKFEGFGHSSYRSREIGDAFRTLEKAMLLQLVYPAVNVRLPLDIKYRTPKLQMVDTGLVNHVAGLQGELLSTNLIEDAYRGKIAEHLAGQELISAENSVLARLNYWIRDSRNSQAEIDWVFPFKGMLIPVEVKSGPSGKLKSLHLYMDKAPHSWAVRIYSGKTLVEEAETPLGKKFSLISLPFYLAGRMAKVIENHIK
jgi:predicted AAA+ superfamily ATPase